MGAGAGPEQRDRAEVQDQVADARGDDHEVHPSTRGVYAKEISYSERGPREVRFHRWMSWMSSSKSWISSGGSHRGL